MKISIQFINPNVHIWILILLLAVTKVDQGLFAPYAYSIALSPVAGVYIFQVLRILKSSDLRPDQIVLM